MLRPKCRSTFILLKYTISSPFLLTVDVLKIVFAAFLNLWVFWWQKWKSKYMYYSIDSQAQKNHSEINRLENWNYFLPRIGDNFPLLSTRSVQSKWAGCLANSTEIPSHLRTKGLCVQFGVFINNLLYWSTTIDSQLAFIRTISNSSSPFSCIAHSNVGESA